jgi:hypothetical protein
MTHDDFEKIQEAFDRHLNSHTEKLIDDVGHHILSIEVDFEKLIREKNASACARDYYKSCCEKDYADMRKFQERFIVADRALRKIVSLYMTGIPGDEYAMEALKKLESM